MGFTILLQEELLEHDLWILQLFYVRCLLWFFLWCMEQNKKSLFRLINLDVYKHARFREVCACIYDYVHVLYINPLRSIYKWRTGKINLLNRCLLCVLNLRICFYLTSFNLIVRLHNASTDLGTRTIKLTFAGSRSKYVFFYFWWWKFKLWD